MRWHTTALATITPPTPAEALRAVAEARRLFMRTLGSWASDMLRLNREGLAPGAHHAPHPGGLSRAA